MTFHQKAWQAVQPVYQKIITHPFNVELGQGTLSRDKFSYYMQQDSLYLIDFAKSLNLIAAKCKDPEDVIAFTRFAEGAIVAERSLHEFYFDHFGIAPSTQKGLTCHHYTHFLLSICALQSPEIGAAAVLPCFWVYLEVGKHIYQNQTAKNNPYQKWIETYAGDEFEGVAQQAKEICDRFYQNSDKKTQDAMSTAFYESTVLELGFWEGAYNLQSLDEVSAGMTQAA